MVQVFTRIARGHTAISIWLWPSGTQASHVGLKIIRTLPQIARILAWSLSTGVRSFSQY